MILTRPNSYIMGPDIQKATFGGSSKWQAFSHIVESSNPREEIGLITPEFSKVPQDLIMPAGLGNEGNE